MKPIISSFIISEDTQQVFNPGTKSNIVHIISPLNVIRPQFIPSGYTFSVSFGLLQLDPDSEHTIRFKLFTPSESIAMDTEDISLAKNNEFDTQLPDEANGLMFNLDFRNVPLRESGMYKGIIIVNNDTIGEYPIFVYPQESL